MSDTKPYSGRSNDRLTDLINLDNNTSLVEDVDFTYGSPEAHVGSGGRNTRIRLIPTDSEQYSESIVTYTRLSINALSQLPEEMVSPVEITELPFSIHDILDDINEALGLDLSEEEVVNSTFTDARQYYPLQIAQGSLAWTPSVYNFRTNVPGTMNGEDGEPILTEAGFPFELESA